MKARACACAHWFLHVNGVNPSREMRDWLTDTVSLTLKLTRRSKDFRVHRLCQKQELCLADEFTSVDLPRRGSVQTREVLLQCDGRPVVFAHTIVPLKATASDWPFFRSLGERSLGTTLFGDPWVRRNRLEFARLPVNHPLVLRAYKAIGAHSFTGSLYARRCLYRRKNGALLVTEVFLPAIAEIRNSAPIILHHI